MAGAQKITFSPNCITRADPAQKIWPVVDCPMDVFGVPRFTLLNALNISQRNCTYFDSVMKKFFNSAVSRLCDAGASKMFMPELPYLYNAGAASAAGLNHSAALGCDTFRSPTRSGRVS